MSYENPQVPHEVNVSRESVLAEFVRLSLGLLVVAILVLATLYFVGGRLAKFVPYSMEQRWVGERVLAPFGVDSDAKGKPDSEDVRAYLQRLTDDLARRMDLPHGMRPVVHWDDTDVPNAFATLGGHVIVTRGLYERMPSENALAMVLAHELAHLRERDPISAVGGSASLALVLVLLGGDVGQLVPHVATAVQLGYSRSAERRADAAAIGAVVAKYGHAGGAAAVFEVLASYGGKTQGSVPTLLSTHPADDERIASLRRAAEGWNAARQPLQPIAIRASR